MCLGPRVLELFWRLGGKITKPLEALGHLTVFVKSAAKQLGLESPPWNYISYTMIKSGPSKEPRLKLKASETRRALNCVHHLLNTVFPPRNPHETLVAQCVGHAYAIYAELGAWDPLTSGARTSSACRSFMALYGELNRESAEQGRHLTLGWIPYKWYPKFHQFVHVMEDQIKSSGNPRDHWCYADESAIGDAVDVAEHCHSKFLHRNVITKHRL